MGCCEKQTRWRYPSSILLCLCLWASSACSKRTAPTKGQPDFSIDLAPTSFYPYADTSAYVERIQKEGPYFYWSNAAGLNWKYFMIREDTLQHDFELIPDYRRRRQKRSRKRARTVPKNWPYASLPPDYSKFTLLLKLIPLGGDSVLCEVIHLPDTTYYRVKTVGRMKHLEEKDATSPLKN